MTDILEILEDHNNNANVKQYFQYHWNQIHPCNQLIHHKVQLISIQPVAMHLK